MVLKKNEVRRQFHPDSLRVTVCGHSRLSGAAAGPRGLATNYLPDNTVKQEDMRSLREEPVAVERG